MIHLIWIAVGLGIMAGVVMLGDYIFDRWIRPFVDKRVFKEQYTEVEVEER